MYFKEYIDLSVDSDGRVFVPNPDYTKYAPIYVSSNDAVVRIIGGRNWDYSTIVYIPSKANTTDSAMITYVRYEISGPIN